MPTTHKEDEVKMYDRQAKHKGCLPLILLALLTLSLLACGLSDAVQKVAEPLDEHGCRVDCQECEFSRYIYETNSCFCLCGKIEIQLY